MNPPTKPFEAPGGELTAREIAQQPDVWLDVSATAVGLIQASIGYGQEIVGDKSCSRDLDDGTGGVALSRSNGLPSSGFSLSVLE